MGATTTPSISWLVKQLKSDYSQFNFKPGKLCAWSPADKTIYYDDTSPAQLLHELAHALLDHQSFKRDLELIEIERTAWQYALLNLAPTYQIKITKDAIEDAMDSYRDWLHARSRCPECLATGVQTALHAYRCLSCQTSWQVNDARQTELRRFKL